MSVLRLTFRPGDAALGVTIRLTGVPAAAGRPYLQAPISVANVPGVPYGERDVAVTDEAGTVPMRVTEDDTPAGRFKVPHRVFVPERDSRGEVTVVYEIPVIPAMTPKPPGAAVDLRGHDGGMGGCLAGFMLLPPEEDREHRIELGWELGPGMQGVSTLGADATTIADLRMSVILAGRLGSHVEGDFHAYWLGTPTFDTAEVMGWAARAHAALRDHFGAPAGRPYYLLARAHPKAGDSGIGAPNGFMLEYGTADRPGEAVRTLLAHEMVHSFVGSLDGPHPDASWYGEGLAEWYKAAVPYRAGLLDAAAYERVIGDMTDQYYLSPRNDLPNDRIGAEFWLDSRVQRIPYNRGLMYLAEVDAQVRAASGGERSLDDLVAAALRSRDGGDGYDEGVWRELLAAELGPAGLDGFASMLAGRLIEPPDDAFEPGFTRVGDEVCQFELGFAVPSLHGLPARVTGLVPGSSAAEAGLREGDEICGGDDPETARKGGAEVFTLEVRRDGAAVPIRFSPLGAKVRRHRWVRR